MKNTLLNSGFKGEIHVIPNFKQFPFIRRYSFKTGKIIHFVFISRVSADKGVREIFEAADLILESGITGFSITIYGPIDSSF